MQVTWTRRERSYKKLLCEVADIFSQRPIRDTGDERMKTKTIKKVVTLDTCDDHEKGFCYIRLVKLTKKKEIRVYESENRDDCVADYDKDGNLLGLEFYMGLQYKKSKGKELKFQRN